LQTPNEGLRLKATIMVVSSASNGSNTIKEISKIDESIEGNACYKMSTFYLAFNLNIHLF